MKKVLLAFLPWLLSAFCYKAMAQDETIVSDNKDKKETQEIVIRKKGDKDANITIQISGDKVTINGKPLVEFKDDEITINKRKITLRDGSNLYFSDGFNDLDKLGNDLDELGSLSWDEEGENDWNKSGAFLGVTTEKDDKGAKITHITEVSAAGKAGLKEGDIITKVGDEKIDGPESLSKAITAKKPKDEVKVYYIRDGKEKSVKATLEQRKSFARSFSYSSPDGYTKTLTLPRMKQKLRSYNGNAYGLTTPQAFNYDFNPDVNISFPRQKKLGLRIQDTEDGTGVKVLDVEDSSAAATAGVKKDDVLTEIGGVKVTNTDEVREQLQENSEKSSYTIKAKRNGSEMSFEIKIPKKLKTANL